MLKILVSLIALSKQLDIYLLTDGPGWTSPDANYEKLNWKRAKSWIEFLFDRSAVLEQAQTNLYFISRYSSNLILYIFYLYLVKIVQIRTLKKEESVIALVDERPERMALKDGLAVDRGFNLCLPLVQIPSQH